VLRFKKPVSEAGEDTWHTDGERLRLYKQPAQQTKWQYPMTSYYCGGKALGTRERGNAGTGMSL
jgi:hypothetical protein